MRGDGVLDKTLEKAPRHPAPFSTQLMPVIADLLSEHLAGSRILDPFAGIGRIHQLREHGYTTIGIELEQEWAQRSEFTQVGDATALVFSDDSFDAVVTSPTFGNRMADSHRARDSSHRRTYTHYLGRDLSENNSGAMQWGPGYRNFHSEAWNEVYRVLVPGGVFLLNIKDHQRDKQRAHVSVWHYQAIKELGFELVDLRRVETPGYRFGENREVRYPERVLVFRSMKSHPDKKQTPHVTSMPVVGHDAA